MYIVVTNNVKCRDRYQDKLKVDFLENGSYIDVLIKVRNYIHKGYRLETHPIILSADIVGHKFNRHK